MSKQKTSELVKGFWGFPPNVGAIAAASQLGNLSYTRENAAKATAGQASKWHRRSSEMMPATSFAKGISKGMAKSGSSTLAMAFGIAPRSNVMSFTPRTKAMMPSFAYAPRLAA